MRATEFGVEPKRPARTGSRPARGHETVPRYKTDEGVIDVPAISKRIIQMRQTGLNDQQIRAQLIKEGIPPRYIDQAFAGAELNEGKKPKQEPAKPRNFVAKNAINTGAGAHKDKKKAAKQGDVKHKNKELAEMDSQGYKGTRDDYKLGGPEVTLGPDKMLKAKDVTKNAAKTLNKTMGKAHKKDKSISEMELELDEWKASRKLCRSSTPDKDLGASALASCKSQGLRARDGNKSHLMGKGPESRMVMGGHRVKGKKYGGKIPDWGTRK